MKTLSRYINEYMTGLISFLSAFLISLAVYFGCNKGMAHNARGQQVRRFLLASLFSCVPLSVAWSTGLTAAFIPVAVLSAGWMITFPLLFHLSNRRTSPDYENYMDIAFGAYLWGWLSSVILLCGSFGAISTAGAIVAGLVEFVLLMILFSQVVYYWLYGVCIDANGMKILQDTHYNEIIEFARSFSPAKVLAVAAMTVALLFLCLLANVGQMPDTDAEWWQTAVWCVCAVALSIYMWKKSHGVFVRTGIVKLWLDIKDYSDRNSDYVLGLENRMRDLVVERDGKPYRRPSTVMVIIGESASRDHMTAFKPEMEHDTTPWMRRMAEDKSHTVIFPNAYSCAMHTVQVLEKSLTEYNLYDEGKQFVTSCSIVDIAHKMGWRVHWYSNQGHLGAADTPITIVAETSDTAKWTKQELGRVQYDQSLVDFLDEVDPEKDNLVVLHLKGSHFNFLNRYPQEKTVWGTPGVQDNVLNYENSLRYTDSILQQFYDYGRKRLNLQSMIYFSDHATVPDRKRSPAFCGFGETRIPLFVWVSDEYIELHGRRFEALKANRDKYWTNDLFYELFCGVMDISSNRFREDNSLASPDYRFTRDMLLTYEGRTRISDDNTP